MQWLAALCVRRPVFASVLMLSLTVVGLFAFFRLGVDRFPNIDIPIIVVTTRLPGAAPEQIETEITDKIEEAVNTISGIDTLSSVVVGGDLAGRRLVRPRQGRRHRGPGSARSRQPHPAAAAAYRRSADRREARPDASPVITVAVTAAKPIRDITEFADKVLRRRLESVDGVGQVVVIGGRKRQINVWLDAAALRGQTLSVNDVARALQAQNLDIPGGRLEQGPQSVTLRTRGRVDTVEGFGDVVLRESNGHAVRLRDVARVEDGLAEPAAEASVNGEPTVLLQIRKQSGTNTVQVVDDVKQRLAEVEAAPAARLPARHRARRLAVHRSASIATSRSTSCSARSSRRSSSSVPRQLPLDDHRGHRDPDLDHRHLRADVVHGLHAQHA